MRKGLAGIVWSLILIGAGTLFLLGNVFPELRPWRLLARYWSAPWLLFAQFWPLIIIAWGISKLLSYLRSDQDPVAGRKSLLSGGDVVLLVFLLIAGTTATNLTKAFHNGFFGWKSDKDRFRFDPEDWDFADSRPRFEFSEEVSQPVTADRTALEVVNRHGNIAVFVHGLPSIKVNLQEKVRAEDEARGRGRQPHRDHLQRLAAFHPLALRRRPRPRQEIIRQIRRPRRRWVDRGSRSVESDELPEARRRHALRGRD